MFIAAIAHKYSFPHDPFHINIPDYGSDRTWCNALAAMWDLSDVQQDVSDHLGVVGSSLSRRLRGRGAYQPARSSNETEHLFTSTNQSMNMTSSHHGLYQSGAYQPSASNASTATLHSGKQRYGAFDTSNVTTSIYNKPDAITIVKQTATTKDYSPQYGVPRPSTYFFNQNQPTTSNTSSLQNEQTSRSDNTSRSESTYENLGAVGGTATADDRTRNMTKSDSTNSDWLSTPTDDFMGIDIRGIEKDRINLRGNDHRL